MAGIFKLIIDMLDQNIKDRLKILFAELKADITFRLYSAGVSEADAEMKDFLEEVASTSTKISVETAAASVDAPTFGIVRGGVDTGVRFCGIPNGHEFSTLLLAVLNADGQGKNLPDETLARRIKAIKGPVKLQTFVSLTCTNCPDVAQALNVVALLNPSVENTVTDGAVVPELVKKYNIQSVPAVYADGKLLSIGRSTLGDLIDKLESAYGADSADADSTPVVREYDALVLGGGPAGTAAAVYLARKGFSVAVIAKAIGGQVRETMGIENLISVPETTGPQLAADLKEHLGRYPVDVYENRTVDAADVAAPQKVLVCGNETFKARALVIATGAGWRKLSVPGEEEHIGRGVAFCTHCDGPFYAGKRVAVVGGGNSGIEAAIDLAGMCPHVDVFEFLDTLKADGVLQEKAKSMDNIDIHVSSQVIAIEGDGKNVRGIRVKDRVTGLEEVYPVAGVFVQIGLVPNSSLFKDALPLSRGGEIIVDRCCRTGIRGVYAAGDVTDIPYKQIIVAMGEGAKAALSVFEDAMRGELG